MTVYDLHSRFCNTGRLPVIYLSGPMTGKPDDNFPAFNEMARKLRLLGFPVLNPADFGHGPPGPRTAEEVHDHWVACLTRDLPLVASADVLVLLEGWEESRGACLEFDAALAFKLPAVQVGQRGRLSQFIDLFIDPDRWGLISQADRAAEQVRRIVAEGGAIGVVVVRAGEDEDEDERAA